jgi:prepilin-type N-terminal cleavage/methylation domain-containing protein
LRLQGQYGFGVTFMKRAFTLVELVIIISILGILAAIVIPTLANYTTEVKQSTAKDHLRTLRTFIEIYASNNDGVPPGYPGNDMEQSPTDAAFTSQMTAGGAIVSIIKFPENPFNGKNTVKIIGDSGFPAAAEETNIYGWIYQPASKTIRLNWSGTDNEGIDYFNY